MLMTLLQRADNKPAARHAGAETSVQFFLPNALTAENHRFGHS